MSSSELNCGTSLRASSHSSLSLLRLDDDESENTTSSRTYLNNLGGSSSNNNNTGGSGGALVGHHRTRNTDGGPSSKRTLLADMPVTEELTLLRRREVEIGNVLGRGRYSEVHSIQRIHLNNNNNNNNNSTAENPDTAPEQQQQPQKLDTEGKQQRYVMKHIQNKLFANRGHRRWQRDLTNAIADLVTEAMYLSKLNHPHIIRLRGLTRGGTSVLKRPGANGEDYFLLLDRMEETLDYRIHQRWKKTYYSSSSSSSSSSNPKKKPRQSFELVMTKIRYSHQMAQALSYLHDHQIIFRDYKPENCGFVLQDSKLPHTDPHRDRLQLFDFGLARELDEPPPPTPPLLPPASECSDQQQQQPRIPERLYSLSASGTRRYMAPEIFNGKQYNYKADVYSWAVVFFESLSHVKPFADFTTQSHEELVCRLGGRPKLREIDWPSNTNDDSTAAAAANDVAAQGTDGSTSLSEEIESLLQRAWNQDLYQRPSMARVCMELEDLLMRRQGSLGSSASSPSVPSVRETPATGAQATSAYSSSSSASTATTIQEVVQQNSSPAPAPTSSSSTNISTTTNNNNEDVNPFLQKKTSTSELTSATDPMASDSEEVSLFDDNSHPNNSNSNSNSNSASNSRATRWSHSSGRSSISSFGGIPSH